MKQIPTLRELARKAGVHHTTVSRALRNDPGLPEKTKSRIKALAEAEGYRPDPLVVRSMAAMRRGRAGAAPEVLGLLTSETRMGQGNEPFRAFCRTIARRAGEHGYRIDELWTKEPGMSARRMDRIILTRGIEGIIIPPHFSRAGGHISLDFSRLATVLHSHSTWRPRLHRVEANHFQNMLIVTREIYRRGYRRIGLLLLVGADRATGHEWEGGYHYFLAAHPDVARIPFFYSEGFDDEKMLKWVKKHRLDVIIGAYPTHPELFRKAGFRVPEDLGLVSMGVNPREVAMAGLDMLAEAVDSAAVDVLVAQINRNERGVPAVPRCIQIEGVWKDGPTVRPFLPKPSKPSKRRKRGG